MTGRPRIWIAWETQRRSITLSKYVGAELYVLDWESRGIWRYPLSLIATAKLLFRNRRGVVFVQNPSMVLATFAAFCKRFMGFTLIVDRHSNFVLGGERMNAIARRAHFWMSQYTIRRADITIVTNDELVRDFIQGRGLGFVLPDPYPLIGARAEAGGRRDQPFEILFVSTWQTDEPIREVIEVCRVLGDRVRVLISGRVKPAYQSLVDRKPDNFVLTGFLPDDAYFDLMRSVDAVMAISTRPATLCCGAYEGIAAGKPVILGDSSVTKQYFCAGAVYTDSTVEDLERQIRYLMDHHETLKAEVDEFYVKSADAWTHRLETLNQMIDDLP